jgi:hypothetical protein
LTEEIFSKVTEEQIGIKTDYAQKIKENFLLAIAAYTAPRGALKQGKKRNR